MNYSKLSNQSLASWVTIAALGLSLAACGPSEPVTEGTPPDIRRLTEEQYRNIIADVFGSSIVIGGRFDTPVRSEGLLAVGARKATVTSGGLAQFDEMARSVASQVMSEERRSFLVPCDINEEAHFDEACTKNYIEKVGRKLFRRPMTDEETLATVQIVRDSTDTVGSFREGLTYGLSSLLVAPQFLFVTDLVEDDPTQTGQVRLDGFSKAARLSFFLWNTGPDEALLLAAENGDLHTSSGLNRQVTRMMESPRFAVGIRAFFSDLLEFSEFTFLEKDSVIYPSFGVAAARDSREQTLRTIVDHVINLDADYRDLFTTKKTFMTRSLGPVYRTQVSAPNGVWETYEFAEDDPRAGIQSHIGFLALHSHPGRSSPTLRGKAIRNTLLCQQVPPPPPDVDFSGFNDPNSPVKTARERLTAHNTNAACAGCHKITDPIGLPLEQFDGAGQFRLTENGAIIDASGSLDGIEFGDSSGLGLALRDNPAVISCVVNQLYAYASGASLSPRSEWKAYLEDSFASENFSLKALIERVATSNTFYAVSLPVLPDNSVETAMNTTHSE